MRLLRTIFDQEIGMKKTLLIVSAFSLVLSGAAFAGGAKHAKRSAAPHESASAVTMQDCQMLTVSSARKSCEQHAERGNGGIDSAAVGMSSDASGGGSVGLRSDTSIANPPGYSAQTGDPATYSNSPR
jgi:hypothetical protein